ncbi:MAG: VTT domain-containing protein [Gemmatimonadota bacterium]|nr:VTT domain-containing protein [Gemmatimonadota bacterium]MDH3478206.1 VTT domain-containing protein [Gemmatimonadota bacterium]MDH3569757.1 VTT domain-containing protein [Gemmatimonadota bacterium]MDH5549737.1 VTT domain-containing protein [Gemmatimonadota bacterium]
MLDPVVQFIENSGGWVYVLAPLFMIVVAILPFPAEIPAMLNGMVFGATLGSLITWSGAVVGALVSFELARRFGRPLARRVLSDQALATTDRMAHSAGWPALLTVRFIPAIAFTVVNWASGLTAIPRWTFAWTTALGIIPGAIVFTLTGSGLGALYRRAPAVGGALIVLAVVVIAWSVIRPRRSTPATP